MAKLSDLIPEVDDIKAKATKKSKETQKITNFKAQGRKRRAWLSVEEELSNTSENENSTIELLNSISDSQNDKKEQSIKEKLDHNVETIQEINPFKIRRWAEKDRPSNELGDIEGLAKNLKDVGQLVPCIVRPIKENEFDYELVVGECRWEAAKIANIRLKAIIRELDDHEASLVQAVENEKRKDLSEFAKGMSYATKIDKGLLSQKDLINILGISKQQVSRLLSFKKIPITLFEAIDDFRNVSARTAEELCRYTNKGNEYIDALISLAPKIRTGKFGEKRIKKDLEKILLKSNKQPLQNKKVFDSDGRHLFTWRMDNNNTPSIHFPKDIAKLLNNEQIEIEELTTEIKSCVANKLNDLKQQSPRGD